ncbi:MAG: tyrosine-type recombinase/integrase [Synergistes sp.]|nr:tyrosine-type recombinase/integrase [Synergistes sp.]
MANVNLTANFVDKLKPTGKRVNIHDKIINELILYMSPKGNKTYYLDIKLPNGKRTSKKIGDAMLLAPQAARQKAKEMLLRIQEGETFLRKLTFGELIDDYYEEYALENLRTGAAAVKYLRKYFSWLNNKPAEHISMVEIERWRADMRKTTAATSVNRYITWLRGALSYAYKRKLISTNPLKELSALPESDKAQKVRYLTDEERAALMAALDEREKEMREKRIRTRQHAKGQHLLDTRQTVYADFFKPTILTALGTGIRRNALFHLRWEDIDFRNSTITLKGIWAKNKKTAIIPMSEKVKAVLVAWQKECPSQEIVFPSPKDGGYMDNANKTFAYVLDKAGIKNFRWHDMRHDFASRLAMAGVDLNTIRELMTHSDISTTMIYAHLSPNIKKKAVDLI